MPASRVIDVWQPELTELAETSDIDEAMDDRKFEYSDILAREMESLLSRIYGSCLFVRCEITAILLLKQFHNASIPLRSGM